jgi:hypothetical protein
MVMDDKEIECKVMPLEKAHEKFEDSKARQDHGVIATIKEDDEKVL